MAMVSLITHNGAFIDTKYGFRNCHPSAYPSLANRVNTNSPAWMSTLRQANLLIDIGQISPKHRIDQQVIMTIDAGMRLTNLMAVQRAS
jgi:hypothetical protein